MQSNSPFVRQSRSHVDGEFHGNEARLANRNSGIPLEMLRHDVTPVGAHYLLSHFDVPYVASDDWQVEIGGAVGDAQPISLAEIKRLPQRTVRVTLECAGNGRALVKPRYPSMPWHHEAVSTAEWTGTSLRHVLEGARLAKEATHVAFIGADRGFDNGVEHNFGRALARDHALSDDVLLVYAMNGAALLPQHGFPLRLIVPGWYGMASVKWLTRIEALTEPFDGYQQTPGYHYRERSGEPGVPVREMRAKSLMVPPGIPDWYTRQRMVEAGRVEIFGRAWSGDGVPIAKVELACDGVWTIAALDPPSASPYAWRGWRCTWQAEAGPHELMCRATDAGGATQPLKSIWDNGGFGNNAVQRMKVWVR
jgi:DMSO/TMAO reductase YedYZ molybdopterin-dependent catalytic subunit